MHEKPMRIVGVRTDRRAQIRDILRWEQRGLMTNLKWMVEKEGGTKDDRVSTLES